MNLDLTKPVQITTPCRQWTGVIINPESVPIDFLVKRGFRVCAYLSTDTGANPFPVFKFWGSKVGQFFTPDNTSLNDFRAEALECQFMRELKPLMAMIPRGNEGIEKQTIGIRYLWAVAKGLTPENANFWATCGGQLTNATA